MTPLRPTRRQRGRWRAAVVAVVSVAALLPGAAQAQTPPEGETALLSKTDDLSGAGTDAVPGMHAVWSATMTVGAPGQLRGHDYLGYSIFKSSGELEPTAFTYRDKREQVQALAYSKTARGLGLAVTRRLPGDVVLRAGGADFAIADAAERSSPQTWHAIYEWEDAELDWARGDKIAVSLLSPPIPILDTTAVPSRPNVVLILADDLGWGDVASNNPDSAMTTPHIDSIAAGGVNFPDAHSPSSVCSPTRYGLLTGRYPWRSWLKRKALWGYDRPMIERGQPTLATLLQDGGYHTSAVGKWHLGMEYPLLSDPAEITAVNRGFDFNAPILDGPLDHGFDEFFGSPANLGWTARVWVSGDRFIVDPDYVHSDSDGYIVYDEALDRLTGEAVSFIERSSRDDSPFFLYLPVPVPHTPVAPNRQFEGSTGLGGYADYMAQLDWSVGQVLDAIDRAGAGDDTLVIFTSDNGSYKGNGIPLPNHATHHSNGHWRDGKGAVYEGGHRVPLMMQWPAAIAPGSQIDATVSLTDLYATLAEITGKAPEQGTAPDSVSLLPLLRGDTDARGVPVVHHSQDGMFSLRDGPWKLVLGRGTGTEYSPHRPFSRPYQIYNLDRDPTESRNLVTKHSKRVDSMSSSLERIRGLERQTLSSDSTLRVLGAAGVDLGSFDPATLHYEATVDEWVRRIPMAAVPSAADASARVWNGRRYDISGNTVVRLPETVNRTEVRVTSPDGTSTTAYTVTITKERPPTAVPVIAGTAQEGQILFADASRLPSEFLIEEPAGSSYWEEIYGFQWVRSADGEEADIAGATSRIYIPVEDDVGARLMVRVTNTHGDGASDTRTSAPTEQVAPAPDAPTTGSPRIVGTARAGAVLTADLSGVGDHDGIDWASTRYQWVADDEPIAGATGRRYTVQPGDADKSIQVRVWITDRDGNTALLVSPAAAQPAPSVLPPYRPEVLRAEIADGAVRLSWNAPENLGFVNGHRIWRSLPESGEPEPAEHAFETHGAALSFTDADVAPGVLYSYRVQAVDLFGYVGEVSQAVAVRVPAAPAPPLTADVSGVSEAHDGQSPVRFELAFSEEPQLSYLTLRDSAFSVTGGEVIGARRLDRPSNQRWEITVRPAGSAAMVVVLAPTADCADSGAICTGDGEPLSNRIEISIAGP